MAEIVNLIMQHVTQAGFFLRGSNGLGGLFALSILGGAAWWRRRHRPGALRDTGQVHYEVDCIRS